MAVPHIFVAGTTAESAKVNADFLSLVDGTAFDPLIIDNTHIKAAANIAFSKFAALASGNILVGSAGNVATSVAMTGDVTITAAGVTAITAGCIVNNDINAAAAIVSTKLVLTAVAQNIIPSTDGARTLGSATYRWSYCYADTFETNGTTLTSTTATSTLNMISTSDVDAAFLKMSGTTLLTMTTANILCTADFKPITDSTYDLGTTALRWANLWVDVITVTTSVAINGTDIDSNEIDFNDATAYIQVQNNNLFTLTATDATFVGTTINLGTGKLELGTFTSDTTLTNAGYITIKDAGGVLRKLCVITSA